MSKLLVLIDNGHGVETKGKRSPDNRLMEWKWNREMAQLLYRRLNDIGIAAHLLVTEEADVSLGNRCLRANTIAKNFKAQGYECLFISVHVNAGPGSGWSNASGVSVHVYKDGGEKSKGCGKIYTQKAREMKLTGNRSIPSCGYWECNFYVCKNTNMPAVLIEHDFMTNKASVDMLLSDEGKQKFLKWHEESILNYIQKYNINE